MIKASHALWGWGLESIFLYTENSLQHWKHWKRKFYNVIYPQHFLCTNQNSTAKANTKEDREYNTWIICYLSDVKTPPDMIINFRCFVFVLRFLFDWHFRLIYLGPVDPIIFTRGTFWLIGQSFALFGTFYELSIMWIWTKKTKQKNSNRPFN